MGNNDDVCQLNHDSGSRADPSPAPPQSCGPVYQITIRGQLSNDWSDWLDGLQMTTSASGNTVLSGTIVDQAALIGILNKLNRLNVALLSLGQADDTKNHE